MARGIAFSWLLCGLFLSLSCRAQSVIAATVEQTPARAIEKKLDKAEELIPVDLSKAASLIMSVQQDNRLLVGNAKSLIDARSYWLLSEISLRKGDAKRSIKLNNYAFNLAKLAHASDNLFGNIYLTKGGISSLQMQPAKSLAEYMKAYEFYSKSKNERRQAVVLLCISILYNYANDFQSAIKYISEALEKKGIDQSLAAYMIINRGAAMMALGDAVGAKTQFIEAKTKFEKLHNNYDLVLSLLNLSDTQIKLNEIAGARVTIAEALTATQTGNAAPLRYRVLANASLVALRQGQQASAAGLIEKAFDGIDTTKTTSSDYRAHEAAFEVYMASHNPAKALPHLVALKRLDDEQTKVATTTSAQLMGAKFNFANQELRIARLKQEELRRNVQYAYEQARTERYIFYGVAGTTVLIIVLLGIGLVTIRRSRDEVRAANDDLALTNAALGKALAAKTEFLATTSHEIRTPLNGILGMTQVMLADRTVDGNVRERLTLVHDAGSTMKALVDDILDVAKMETGEVAIEAAPFDLCATVEQATRLWSAQARGKGLAFSTEIAACPRWVIGDAARVRQVVFNLLSNAVKFTAEGLIAVTVEERDGTYTLSVADTGIGIDPAKHEEIFEAFRQADAGTTRQYGGTGLGLAICKRLVSAMGGEIGVESRLGQGATFRVTLPLPAAEQPQAMAPEPGGGAVADLLVVEANPITRSMMRTLFAPHFASVEFVANVAEGSARIEHGLPARLLVDATAGHGDELGRLIATAAADGVVVVVLVAAGSDSEAWLGASRVVTKPVTGKVLAQVIAEMPLPLVIQAA